MVMARLKLATCRFDLNEGGKENYVRDKLIISIYSINVNLTLIEW